MKNRALVVSRSPLPTRVPSRRLVLTKPCALNEADQRHDPIKQGALCLLGTAALSLSFALGPEEVAVLPAFANLPSGVTVTSARALLRNALPIKNAPMRTIQRNLEAMDEYVRIPGNTGFNQVSRAAKKSLDIIGSKQSQILADVTPSKREEAAMNLEKLRAELPELIESISSGDKNQVLDKQQILLEYVNSVEEALVQEFPFSVPSEYKTLPQLKGRATVEMKINIKEKFRGDVVILRMVIDGYNAPVTAGDFIDLVQKKFYDGMEIQRADGFVVQTGRPEKGEFYIDPKTNEPRMIPLEVKIATDKEPIYEESLEDVGRFNEQTALPFNAYGTMAMARSEFDNNSASSQFFFLLKESELTPSGSNLLDGRYSVFGYVVDGQEALGNLKVGDVIESMRVVRGSENLQVA